MRSFFDKKVDIKEVDFAYSDALIFAQFVERVNMIIILEWAFRI